MSKGRVDIYSIERLAGSEFLRPLSLCVGKKFMFFEPNDQHRWAGEYFLFGEDWMLWRKEREWWQDTEIGVQLLAYAWRMSGPGWSLGGASDCRKAEPEELGVLEGIYGQTVEMVRFDDRTMDITFFLTGGCRIELLNLAYEGCEAFGLFLRVGRDKWALDSLGAVPLRSYLPWCAKPGTIEEDGKPAG